MKKTDRLFIRGNRNPAQSGFSIRATCGDEPECDGIEQAAAILQRNPFYIDKRGYEYDLIAAAMHAPTNRLAYVQSRARKKWWSSMVDISIKIHLRDANGQDMSVDIKSYNPFFGCDVGFFDWVDDTAVLLYTEKHNTYVCAFSPNWPPQFVKIEDRWIIRDGILEYLGYQENIMRRLTIPALLQLESVPVSEVEENGMLPPDPYEI